MQRTVNSRYCISDEDMTAYDFTLRLRHHMKDK